MSYFKSAIKKNFFDSNINVVDTSSTIMNIKDVLDLMCFFMKNYDFVAKQKKQEQETARIVKRAKTIENFNPILKKTTFTKEMVWKNIDYGVDPNPLIIEAGRVKILDDLRKILTFPLENFFNNNQNIEPPPAYENFITNKNYTSNTRLNKYLTGQIISKQGILG